MPIKIRKLKTALFMTMLNAAGRNHQGAASWFAHSLILHDDLHEKAPPGALEKSTALVGALE